MDRILKLIAVILSAACFGGAQTKIGSIFIYGTIAQLPSTCVAGQVYAATNGAPGEELYLCAAGSWVHITPGTAALTFPFTAADIDTPVNPTAGNTEGYTKGGRFCSLDSTGSENCTGNVAPPIVLNPLGTTSYANPGGSGDRRTGSGAIFNMINVGGWCASGGYGGFLYDGDGSCNQFKYYFYGNIGLFGWYTPTGPGIVWDFGASPKVIQEFQMTSSLTTGQTASFKWQGSNDNVTYTDLTGPATWSGNTIWSAATNNTFYRYYRWYGLGGSVLCPGYGSCNVTINFKISGATDGILAFSNSGRSVYTGQVDSTGATHTLPARTGTIAAKPATCTIGELYFATDATAGKNLYFCTALNTWTATP